MATDRAQQDGVTITQFYGGTIRGMCLQVTMCDGHGYVQLTTRQAEFVRDEIMRWIREREQRVETDVWTPQYNQILDEWNLISPAGRHVAVALTRSDAILMCELMNDGLRGRGK